MKRILSGIPDGSGSPGACERAIFDEDDRGLRATMGEMFLGRYEAREEVGRGGMAVVYRGLDHVLQRDVAVKVLHAHLCQRSEARARFGREARVVAKLKHSNIVEVYDFSGEESEKAFIVVEFVEGRSLSQFLEDHGPVVPEIAALLAAVVARALQHAHERGVIHRDVKPENLMVRKDGVLKLTDFGIAHVTDMEHLTMTGAIIGSPAHMSPEQVDGKALDARTDIFSLGTLFYLAATGEFPFTGTTASALLKAIVEARLPDIRTRCPGFPDDLYRVLTRMMARDPDHRYASAAEVDAAIVSALSTVGIGTDEAELARFFTDPAGTTARIRAQIAAARLDRARDFLKAGRPALAIRELDGVLANQPDSPEAARLLDRARKAARRRRVSRTALLAALVAGVFLGAAAAVLSLVPRDEIPADGDVSIPTVAEARRAEAKFSIPRQVPFLLADLQPRRGTVPVSALRPKPAKPGPGIQPVKPDSLIPVTIVAFPPAVRIFVDGTFQGFGSTGEIRLPAGRHRVSLNHPNCDVCRDTEYSFGLDPDNPPRTALRFSIGFRDAVLTVHGPEGGRVLVNGIPRGRTNEPFQVPVTQAAPMPCEVTVLVEGQPRRSTRVTLGPGQTASVGVP